MQFPNDTQSALLFDGPVNCLESILQTFMKVEQAQTGSTFNISEANPGKFYRLFGGDELMVTLEYCDNPASLDVFGQTLGSTYTGIICPDVRERLTRHKSHILINVSHGVLGNVANEPKIAAMFKDIGMPKEGATQPQFLRRLNACALISRVVCEHAMPSLVHWTQSNLLMAGNVFDKMAALPAPSMLHIHPFLFGKQAREGEAPKVGIRTFGMQHFIGGEVVIEPHALPWSANYDAAMAFLNVATADNGYIIPDGDTFGPEDKSMSYRVIHRPAEKGDVPTYEMIPLMHREFGFVADDYVPDDNIINDRSPPLNTMPEGDEAKMELANEWREKRALAEGIGGQFQVRQRRDDSPPPPSASPPTPFKPARGFGRKGIFGRKKP